VTAAPANPFAPQARCAWRWLVALSLLAGASLAAHALEPTQHLVEIARQGWVMENGLPQNTVQALAQSRDGFVWIGTEAGLVRFDGNSFLSFDQNSSPALPANDVRALLATRDGALWVGTGGGLVKLRRGESQSFTEKSGLPSGAIRSLVETSDGTLWAWTELGLAHLHEGRFLPDDGVPANEILSVRAIGEGGLLVVGMRGAALWRDGRWAELAAPSHLPVDGIEFAAEVKGSGLVLASKSTICFEGIPGAGNRRAAARELQTGRELPVGRIQSLLADRSGALWIGTSAGLFRFYGGTLDRMPVSDPLASASILSLLEDREGNLWVGTETGGLHILRDQRFRVEGVREGLPSDKITSVVEDRSGHLWVGTNGGGLHNHESGGRVRNLDVRDGLLSDVILSLAPAPNGDLWVGTPDGLNRIRGRHIDAYTLADGLPDDFIRSLYADADGSLWIGTRHGLAHWPGASSAALPTHVETITRTNGLGSDMVGAIERDNSGDLWVATFGGLSRLHGHQWANFTTANGLSSNVVTALLPRSDGSLVVGTRDKGWNLFRSGHFSPVRSNGLEQSSIYAILDDHLGHLWFATAHGIARCDCQMADGCSHWIEFGTADGLRSREMASGSHPAAWRSHDGHLWFATAKGLVEVDPAHFPVNSVPPSVVLERFSIDDQPQTLTGLSAPLRIASGHVHFEFDYAGLSFTAPQKVRYRYKLEGFDRNWTDAGSRRTAYYTNIPPGHYTFRVQAENNDGEWSEQSALLAFELRPHFYQTWWFYGLLLLALAGLVLVALRLRLRRAESEFRAVLGERSRIAREIHDTLAQGYVGISVQLEVLSELLRMNKLPQATKHLDRTREIVRDGLNDARQSIWALRSQDSGETTLPVRLRRLTEKATTLSLEAAFSLYGAYRPLEAGVEQEMLRIAQEAIQNVKKHARAKTLKVQLEYRPEGISMEIRDDGLGFDTAVAPPAGHFGLTGMSERAAAIGATFEVTSEPAAGASVRIHLASSR